MSPLSGTQIPFEVLNVSRYFGSQSENLSDAAITINVYTDGSEELFKAVLPLVRVEFASIEFVNGHNRDYNESVRGAILRSPYGTPLIHVVNALLGYDGSGPNLSRSILRMLGVGSDVYEALNDAARANNDAYSIRYSLS